MAWAAVSSNGKTISPRPPRRGCKGKFRSLCKNAAWTCLTLAIKLNWQQFTQDGAPSHTSNLTQQWCKDHFSHFVNKNEWPSASPNINSMDYFIWSILESKVSSKNYQHTASLKHALTACWKDLRSVAALEYFCTWSSGYSCKSQRWTRWIISIHLFCWTIF